MNLKDVLLHDLTRSHIAALLHDFPHAVLLSGPQGIGSLTLAQAIANEITSSVGSVHVTCPDEKGTISIDAIRALYVQTRGRSSHKSIYIIDTAEAMGREAQNAFLKLLEEPNSSTIFILTSHNDGALLPTIRSRVQFIELKRITRDASLSLLSSKGINDPTIQSQIMFMAHGLPAEIIRLATDTAYLESMLTRAGEAKKFLSANKYEQLVLVSTLAAKPRSEVIGIIELTISMLKSQLSKNQDDALLGKMAAFMQAYERINQNGHVRTQLLRAVQ